MLSALTLVKVGWGSERLGAFAKPKILNIECMKKNGAMLKFYTKFMVRFMVKIMIKID